MLFQSKNPQYHFLKNKWVSKHQKIQNEFLDKHQETLDWLTKTFPLKQLSIGSLSSMLLLSTPSGMMLPQPIVSHIATNDQAIGGTDSNVLLSSKLMDKIPKEVRSLNKQEEQQITELLSKDLGFTVTAELDGKRLNRSYGIIGGEQHLYRYPGDTLYKHAANASEWAMFGNAGIAPGLGAWGYFAPSEEEFTETDKMREKYYLVVQTFLSAGFAENVAEYRDFFRYRKMVVINPKTGQAVVGVIGDSGPGEYTGKHYGGSPEVMHDLNLATGSRKGEVLIFFIDDPENKVPLGPIKNNKIANAERLVKF